MIRVYLDNCCFNRPFDEQSNIQIKLETEAKVSNTMHKLSGSVGDLVFYQLKNKSYIRSKPSSYKDRKSEKQLLQRKKISTMAKLYQVFRQVLRLDIKKEYMNQYNTFSLLNWSDVCADLDNINYANLILCNQIPVKMQGLEVTQVSNKVSFNWDHDHILEDSYHALCAVYCKGIQQVYVSEVKRSFLSADIHLPAEAGEIITYTYTYRKSNLSD
jgi:hypothetical protein